MASFINDLLEKLFPAEKPPLKVKENFRQSEDAKAEVADWIKSEEGRNLIGLIKKNYYYKTSGMNSHPEIHIHNSPYANGFAISYENPLTEKSFSNLFFAFGQRMLDLGYQKVSLDRMIEEIDEGMKTTEKQFFKPLINSADVTRKIDQLYGNVSIEKVMINDKPGFLKILVTIYSDHLYQEAKPFDVFIDELFKSG